MRTVITHFYNEEYLLPWWLRHHVKLFDHGILIDHGSTDKSAEICREIAPNWRLVKSRLSYFDAWQNDFEVMTYELDVKGWKIALNTTEFLISNPSLDQIEKYLESKNRSGISATGMTMVDIQPMVIPLDEDSLVYQKPWAIEDNRYNKRWLRRFFGYPIAALRNRFYHCLPNGMYHVGRHASFHPDSEIRVPNLMILHYAYSPWNEQFITRKIQIASKIPERDKLLGWGAQHMRTKSKLQLAFDKHKQLPFINLKEHPILMRDESDTLKDMKIIEYRNYK